MNLRYSIIALLMFSLNFLNAQTLFQEDFDSGIPNTWTVIDSGSHTGDTWTTTNINGSPAVFVNSDPYSGNNNFIEYLISPSFDASSATYIELEFDQYFKRVYGTSSFVDIYDGTSWVNILSQQYLVGSLSSPATTKIDISSYTNSNMKIRFRYYDPNTWSFYWYIDNISVKTVLCPSPASLNVFDIEYNKAEVSWLSSPTSYQLEWGPTGFSLGSANSLTVGNDSFQITGLTQNTTYDVYVRNVCGSDYSDWIGPVTFSTPYSCPYPLWVEYQDINPNNGFIEWTENGTANTWQIEYGPDGFTQGSGISILTNNNGNGSLPHQLTNLIANTEYDVYVRSVCGAGDSSIWAGPYSFTTSTSCYEPNNLTVINLQTSSADLAWDEINSATSWQVKWDTAGFDPDSASNNQVTGSNPFSVSGLTSNTSHEFYVRSICGAGDSSVWAGPHLFSTPCNTFIAPFIDDVESHALADEITESECWTATQTFDYSWNVGSGSTFSSNTGLCPAWRCLTLLALVSPIFVQFKLQ